MEAWLLKLNMIKMSDSSSWIKSKDKREVEINFLTNARSQMKCITEEINNLIETVGMSKNENN